MKRGFSWERFIKASQTPLSPFLYVYFRAFVEVSYPIAFRDAWVYVSLGLVAWWYVTMLPFVLILGPILIRAVASALPGLVAQEVRSWTLKAEIPRRNFSLAMIVPRLVMLLIGIAAILADPSGETNQGCRLASSWRRRFASMWLAGNEQVLAIPACGVPVGCALAGKLSIPLDVVVVVSKGFLCLVNPRVSVTKKARMIRATVAGRNETQNTPLNPTNGIRTKASKGPRTAPTWSSDL